MVNPQPSSLPTIDNRTEDNAARLEGTNTKVKQTMTSFKDNSSDAKRQLLEKAHKYYLSRDDGLINGHTADMPLGKNILPKLYPALRKVR